MDEILAIIDDAKEQGLNSVFLEMNTYPGMFDYLKTRYRVTKVYKSYCKCGPNCRCGPGCKCPHDKKKLSGVEISW